MKPVAVIILNWNGNSLLTEFLPTVCQNTPEEIADIIVADNGSTDASIETLKQHFPQVGTILFPQNYGFAEGYNRAIEQLQDYTYTVLLNSDVAVAPHWIEPMLSYAIAHPDVAAIQPKIKSYRHPEQFEYAGAAGGFLDRNGYPFCRGRIFDTVEQDNGQYDDLRDIVWASGAALFVRTEIYRQTAGLDPAFFAHMEEIDLCWRILSQGYRIVFIPQSTVYHLGGATLDNASPRKLYLNYRNNLLMMYKNLPVGEGRRRIFLRCLYDGISAIRYLIGGQLSYVQAVWQAHRDFHNMKSHYQEQPTENRLKDFPECRYNIIFDYFIRRRKRFSNLK